MLTICIYHREVCLSTVAQLDSPPSFVASLPCRSCFLCVQPRQRAGLVQDRDLQRRRPTSASLSLTSSPAPPTRRPAPLKRTFDATLYSDLASAGIFDIVSKSLAPQVTPGTPAEINLAQWSNAPASAAMVAFGNLGVQNGTPRRQRLPLRRKEPQYPQVLAKQYSEDASEDSARQIAHRFADEIIFRLGGGIPGIAETKIYYVKIGGGNKEIWEMDYDGANQHAITHLGTVSLSPRVSPDNSRIAFSSLGREGFQIQHVLAAAGPHGQLPQRQRRHQPLARMVAQRQGDRLLLLALRRLRRSGSPTPTATSPAASPASAAPTSRPSTTPRPARRSPGSADAPACRSSTSWTPTAPASQRMTDGGYASSPSWSPNGQFIAFAWDRKYGPGAPGGQDIYVMEVATKRWIQLTHDGGRCDFPSWSPDGRHIVYANSADGKADHMKIWTMLADGTQKRALTGPGADMPNWSWK